MGGGQAESWRWFWGPLEMTFLKVFNSVGEKKVAIYFLSKTPTEAHF